MVCWNPPSGDRLKNSIPDIGTKEGGRDVSVLKIQDRSREGLEFGVWICWKVDELRTGVQLARLWGQGIESWSLPVGL